MAISDAWLKANLNKPRDVTEVRADREGMSVRVSPKGKITYQLRYRYHGRASRVDLGSYPLMGLRAARDESHRLRAKLEEGHDPRTVLAVGRQFIQDAKSLEALFRLWYAKVCISMKRGHIDILRSFELHVLPRIGKLPAREVTLQEWLSLLESLKEQTPSIAERVLTNAKQMYKWGVKREIVIRNPLSDMTAKSDFNIKRNVGSRSLSDDEIRMLWHAIDASRMMPKNGILLKLLLFYGCRVGELRLCERAHFNLSTMVWTVPASNHKTGKVTGKPLQRPILPEIVPLLEEASRLSDSRTLLFTPDGISRTLKANFHLSLPYGIMQWLWRHEDYRMEHWSAHDLRRTARTNFSTLTEPHVAEIMLGHKLPGQWQVYDQHDYLDEQRRAYNKWWNRLRELTLPKQDIIN